MSIQATQKPSSIAGTLLGSAISVVALLLHGPALADPTSPEAPDPGVECATAPIETAATYASHGSYSEPYLSDWALLDSGRALSPGRPADHEWVEETLWGTGEPSAWGSDVAERYPLWHVGPSDCPDVHLTGADIPPLRVRWDVYEPSDHTSVIRIRNRRHVVIEDLAIEQLGHEERVLEKLRAGKHSIFVDGCESLVIRNLYLAGPVSHSHIRVRGCRTVFIENVEVEGVEIERVLSDAARVGLENGSVAGSGINIQNGNDAQLGVQGCPDEIPDYIHRSRSCPDGDEAECYARDLEWVVVQNSHVHDYTSNPDYDIRENNHDGIGIESPADGIVFNNVVEKWWDGNALLDLSHRRGCDPSYSDHLLRVERNILQGAPDEGSLVKTPGWGSPSSAILFANNFYRDLAIMDYHDTYAVFHVNESYFASDEDVRKAWYKMYDVGPSFLENQFVRTNRGSGDVAIKIVRTNELLPDDPADWKDCFGSAPIDPNLCAHSNFYAIGPAPDEHRINFFLKQVEGSVVSQITEFEDWEATGKDVDSFLEQSCELIDPTPDSDLCGAEGRGNSDWLDGTPGASLGWTVAQDFFGTPRSDPPTPGALEAETWRRLHGFSSGIESDVAWDVRTGRLIGLPEPSLAMGLLMGVGLMAIFARSRRTAR